MATAPPTKVQRLLYGVVGVAAIVGAIFYSYASIKRAIFLATPEGQNLMLQQEQLWNEGEAIRLEAEKLRLASKLIDAGKPQEAQQLLQAQNPGLVRKPLIGAFK